MKNTHIAGYIPAGGAPNRFEVGQVLVTWSISQAYSKAFSRQA